MRIEPKVNESRYAEPSPQVKKLMLKAEQQIAREKNQITPQALKESRTAVNILLSRNNPKGAKKTMEFNAMSVSGEEPALPSKKVTTLMNNLGKQGQTESPALQNRVTK